MSSSAGHHEWRIDLSTGCSVGHMGMSFCRHSLSCGSLIWKLILCIVALVAAVAVRAMTFIPMTPRTAVVSGHNLKKIGMTGRARQLILSKLVTWVREEPCRLGGAAITPATTETRQPSGRVFCLLRCRLNSPIKKPAINKVAGFLCQKRLVVVGPDRFELSTYGLRVLRSAIVSS